MWKPIPRRLVNGEVDSRLSEKRKCLATPALLSTGEGVELAAVCRRHRRQRNDTLGVPRPLDTQWNELWCCVWTHKQKINTVGLYFIYRNWMPPPRFPLLSTRTLSVLASVFVPSCHQPSKSIHIGHRQGEIQSYSVCLSHELAGDEHGLWISGTVGICGNNVPNSLENSN